MEKLKIAAKHLEAAVSMVRDNLYNPLPTLAQAQEKIRFAERFLTAALADFAEESKEID